MALRTKEDLQKLYAANRERLERKKIKEQERERIREEKEKEYWSRKKALKYWLPDIDYIAMHSPQILEKLWNKDNLNENEEAMAKLAFELAYPNGL